MIINEITNAFGIKPQDTSEIIKGKFILSSSNFQEGIHFNLSYFSLSQAAYKACISAASDIAAGGLKPKFLVFNLSLPKRLLSKIHEIIDGVKKFCEKYKVEVITGDTTASDKLNFCIILIAQVTGRILRRTGGKEGELICLSGHVGDSAGGLYLLKKGKRESIYKRLISAHLEPQINFDITDQLLKYASCCIDISDGLASDLIKLAFANNLGLLLYKDKIPISSQLKDMCREEKKDAYDFALCGGEDYVLAFSIKEENLKYIKSKVFIVGEFIKKGMFLVDRKEKKPLRRFKGYEHF